jgi:acetyl esterase
MAAILRAQAAAPPPNPELLPIDEARAASLLNNVQWNTPQPSMPARELRVGGVPCRLLLPETRQDGLIVFVHGGGWTFCSPDTHDRFARLLALQAERAVLLPDYRLAPEHRCPAAIEDVLAVLADLATLPDVSGPIALCGDSAGANIALAAILAKPAAPIAALSLLYGCFAPIFDTESHKQNGGGQYGLSTQRMRWYWNNWLGAAADPRGIPLNGALEGLPETYLLAAALDPLCDDSILLAGRLAAAGVATRLDIVPGVVHGFLQMSSRLAPAQQAITTISGELCRMLNNKGGTQP